MPDRHPATILLCFVLNPCICVTRIKNVSLREAECTCMNPRLFLTLCPSPTLALSGAPYTEGASSMPQCTGGCAPPFFRFHPCAASHPAVLCALWHSSSGFVLVRTLRSALSTPCRSRCSHISSFTLVTPCPQKTHRWSARIEAQRLYCAPELDMLTKLNWGSALSFSPRSAPTEAPPDVRAHHWLDLACLLHTQ